MREEQARPREVEEVRAHQDEVAYTADAEALKFLSSQSVTEADVAEIEGTFAAPAAGR